MSLPKADWQSERIEGFAHAALQRGWGYEGARIDAPLLSEILPNLWLGGYLPVQLPNTFKFVVSLYPWKRYEGGPDLKIVEYELYDSADVPDREVLDGIADQINDFRAKGQTLVHCQAGLNRSSLVTAYALIKSGYSAADAISLIREKRSPVALCNEAFENWLLNDASQ